MLSRSLLLAAALAVSAYAQKYDGPVPPKPDLPYLKHADNLLPTEAVTARQEKKKDDTTFVIDGASSPARTPLASPIFILKADKLIPDHLQLFKLESRNGRREILFAAKKQPRAIRIVVTRLSADNIYKVEVDESLDPGEYSLSPSDSDQGFCFQVY
ncbi:MAG: hypothetical protein LAP87_22255 [Acidobacteriia bacterium]|nr:hypothetical protein [Terriglobia bacterium]